ncbi:hypothetical protein DEO72_LG8g2388 [Vigna unguiculata]|uniref:Uncharacterized protein n=1 Tax=Vigna unguiculata TaxID=3917 RepID=A0A4D6MUS1_VIGUN|nr:hypothetical protein DEO72_LG8g2388 [Vigna unguiculata]
MELRGCGYLHFILAIKGGLVSKAPNVARGQPKLKFKNITDIYDDGLLSHNDDGIAERSCYGEIEETNADASEYNVNDDDDQRIYNLDDNDFDNITLSQIKESCEARKRKRSQGLESSRRNIKIEDSFLEDNGEAQMEADDDSDFMETLGSWKSKLSNNMKAKKRCFKKTISAYTQEVMPVVKLEEILDSVDFTPTSEEIQNGQDFPPTSEEIVDCQDFSPSSEEIDNNKEILSFNGDSAALVEVKCEVPETDYFGGPDDYSIVEVQEAEKIYKWNLKSELKNAQQRCMDFLPLRMVGPFNMDVVISNSQLSDGQFPDMPAIEFKSEERIIHPDYHYIAPQQISMVEDQIPDIHDSQPDGDSDSAVTLRSVATHKDLDYLGVDFKDDNILLGDCSNDEFTPGAEDQVVETSPTMEHDLNLDGYLVRCSDDPPEYEEIQSFASVNNECNGSSKLHHYERLLSTRQEISPSSLEKHCKAVKTIDLNRKKKLKSKGRQIYFSEQTDNRTAEGCDDITGARFTDIPNKISVIPRTKRVSHPKGISKIPHSSRQATRLGCSSVQSCSKSAIAFTQQQMHDAECLAMKLTKELKSMKDIVDDMLRSEFCLNTSLRHKVNEARVAVKNATRAEEASKRWLAFMSRDCSRFCKIMKLSDDGPAPQDVVRKERKKIAFADEAGGRLCQVKFYEDDGVSLSESN